MQVTMFLCQYAEDREGAAFNAVGGGLSDVVVARVPPPWFTVYVVVQITAEVGDSGNHVARIDLLDGDSQLVDMVVEATFHFGETANPRATIVRAMRDWKLGNYTVRLSIDDACRASCPLNFVQQDKEEQGA